MLDWWGGEGHEVCWRMPMKGFKNEGGNFQNEWKALSAAGRWDCSGLTSLYIEEHGQQQQSTDTAACGAGTWRSQVEAAVQRQEVVTAKRISVEVTAKVQKWQ